MPKNAVEFVSRMRLQREILQSVNSRVQGEPLSGLSRAAIDRWSIGRDQAFSGLTTSLLVASEKLSFLANKSQEQISDEYQEIEREVRVAHASFCTALDDATR